MSRRGDSTRPRFSELSAIAGSYMDYLSFKSPPFLLQHYLDSTGEFIRKKLELDYVPFTNKAISGLCIKNHYKIWIAINLNQNIRRRFFSELHELAHCLIPWHKGGVSLSDDPGVAEIEANFLAGLIGMPESLFKNYATECNFEIEKIRARFPYSDEAIRRRMRQLRIGFF